MRFWSFRTLLGALLVVGVTSHLEGQGLLQGGLAAWDTRGHFLP